MGVVAYGLHSIKDFVIPKATTLTVFILLAVPFCSVRVVVPNAPDQVRLNGAPAVRPASEGFVNARLALHLAIIKVQARKNWIRRF